MTAMQLIPSGSSLSILPSSSPSRSETLRGSPFPFSSSVNPSAGTVRPSTIPPCLLVFYLSHHTQGQVNLSEARFLPNPNVRSAFSPPSPFLTLPYCQKSRLSSANPTCPKTQFKPLLFQETFAVSPSTPISIHVATVYSVDVGDMRMNYGLCLLVFIFSGCLGKLKKPSDFGSFLNQKHQLCTFSSLSRCLRILTQGVKVRADKEFDAQRADENFLVSVVDPC